MSVIYWFRKALRLHDNPALIAALNEGLELIPLFILDPWFVSTALVGANRWRFLQQTLADLDDSLKNIGSKLVVVRGKPEEVFAQYFKELNVKTIAWEYDSEPYALQRDKTIKSLAQDKGIKIIVEHSHTLYEAERIFQANGNRIPLTYQQMLSVVAKLGPPPKPLDAPTKLPPSCSVNLKLLEGAEFHVPSLKELGVVEDELQPCLFPGGESEALKRLSKAMARKDWVCNFEKPKTSPSALEPSTTVLSPYIKFGCLSARVFYYELIKVYEGKKHSQPPVSLLGQLLWREFFYAVGALSPNFDQMENNPICRQIPWERNEKLIMAWKEGRTGYPFIDALMTQLRKEGWIHHLGRHAVACFLTRGDLWQHWEEGKKVFEEYLLDADWSLNAGNWMWLSASAFFNQYFRVYSPITFGKNSDKDGDFIRKYVPILSKFSSTYIYEPWKAPLADQKSAGCIIGRDYPRPIVNHDVARKKNLTRMGKAYKADKEKRLCPDESVKGSVKRKK